MFGWGRELWNWWLGQLTELLPSFRGTSKRRRAALILVPIPNAQSATAEATARIEGGGRVRHLGRVTLDDEGARALARLVSSQGYSLETVIEIPSGAMLEKRLVLPLAAERGVERVLAYEIDRETPFTADEIYWASTVEQRDRARGRLTVRLAMVAKAQLAGLVAALSGVGLAPAALIGETQDGGQIALPIDHARIRSKGPLDHAVPALSAVCAILAVAAVAAPFIRQSAELDAIDQRIDAMRPTIAAVERLRSKIASDRQQADSLSAQRSLYKSQLAVMAAVTAALPDDSYLTEFDYSGGKLVLSGISKQAAHLIADISRSSALQNPVFSAPVTRMEANGADMFTITVQVRR